MGVTRSWGLGELGTCLRVQSVLWLIDKFWNPMHTVVSIVRSTLINCKVAEKVGLSCSHGQTEMRIM